MDEIELAILDELGDAKTIVDLSIVCGLIVLAVLLEFVENIWSLVSAVVARAESASATNSFQEVRNGVQLPTLHQVVAAHEILELRLLPCTIEEVLDVYKSLRIEGLFATVIKQLWLLDNETDGLGWLRSFMTSDLSSDICLAFFDVLESLVEMLEQSNEDIKGLVTVHIVPIALKHSVRSCTNFTELKCTPNDDSGRWVFRKPLIICGVWRRMIFWAICKFFVINARADIWCRLLATRGSAIVFQLGLVEDASAQILLAIDATASAVGEFCRWSLFDIIVSRVEHDILDTLVDSMLRDTEEVCDELLEECCYTIAFCGAILCGCGNIEDGEPEGIEDNILVAEIPGELPSCSLALKSTLTSLTFMDRLCVFDDVLHTEKLLVSALDVNTHVVKTSKIHGLSLGVPNLLPFALWQIRRLLLIET